MAMLKKEWSVIVMNYIFGVVVMACLVVGGGALWFDQQNSGPGYSPVLQSSIGTIALNASFPAAVDTAPVYRVTGTQDFFEGTPEVMNIHEGVPSLDEAPVIAEKALTAYGGLPADAVLHDMGVMCLKEVNTTDGAIISERPQCVQVIYTQQIDGRPVVGPGAEIMVSLGDGGEVLEVSKAWRNISYARETKIIPVEEAILALNDGNILNRPQSPMEGVEIREIRLGYYAKDISSLQEEYTPVWIFSGIENGNMPCNFIVDARADA
jgi:hypothetical protein